MTQNRDDNRFHELIEQELQLLQWEIDMGLVAPSPNSAYQTTRDRAFRRITRAYPRMRGSAHP